MSSFPDSPTDSPPESATGALLTRYLRGDAAAFRDLVERYYSLVFATAMRRSGGQRALAQDAAQTVFIDLARRAPGLRADERLGGWLHQRALRAAASLMRGESRRRARELSVARDDDEAQAAAVYSLNPAGNDGESWRELAPHLDEALQRLPSRDRDAVLLRFMEGRDFRAVGNALGLSDDAAQKRVSRALEKLRSILLKRRGVATAPAVGLLASALAADHASASAAALPGAALRAASAAMAKTGPLTWAARWLPQLKAAAAGSALACAAWAWPLVRAYQPREMPRPLSGLPTTAGNAAAAAGALHYPVFPALPKAEEGLSVEEIVRRIAALAAGPSNSVTSRHFTFFTNQLEKDGNAAEALLRIAADFPAELRDEMIRRNWTQNLLMRWANSRPFAAMDYAVAHLPLRDPKTTNNYLHNAITDILRKMKGQDPSPLGRWYADKLITNPKLREGDQAKSVLWGVGYDIARMALDASSVEVLQILAGVENEHRLRLFNGLAHFAPTTQSLELLSSLAPRLETPTLRSELMSSVVRRLGTLDPEGARGFVEAVSDPGQRLKYAAIVATPRMITHGEAQIPLSQDARKPDADWWLSMAPPGRHDKVAMGIAERWEEFDSDWSDAWLKQRIPPEVFLKYLRNRFFRQAVTYGWEKKLPRLSILAARLRELDPEGTAAYFDQLSKSKGTLEKREKIQALLKP